MPGQKLPQTEEDCIKCDLPTRMNGLYLTCMNCRNASVKEVERLNKVINDLEHSISNSELHGYDD